MKNTRQQILETARRLFNEKGYSNVTIRMIAQDLGISSGNLNYHFRKRSDILKVLYFEMVKEFDKRVNNLPRTEFSIKKVFEDIRNSMERMVDYQFFWVDIYHILKIEEEVQNHFEEAYKKRFDGTRFLFNKLFEKGLMQQESFDKEYELLAYRMISFSNTWLTSASLYHDKLDVNTHASILIAMLYPYLTPKGKAELTAIIPSYL